MVFSTLVDGEIPVGSKIAASAKIRSENLVEKTFGGLGELVVLDLFWTPGGSRVKIRSQNF